MQEFLLLSQTCPPLDTLHFGLRSRLSVGRHVLAAAATSSVVKPAGFSVLASGAPAICIPVDQIPKK
ncbi:hypothetical protein CMUS01_04116 [Colletotrichum musicola]|uniref:Uncharacterized protein n=1 Tax=Colletotrichum musicola TaxID=2175873 RepID=A0A8H6U164_9PEZI|nr:hypothetical protein CMUS01_04116 [Colletotrichum musicola]